MVVAHFHTSKCAETTNKGIMEKSNDKKSSEGVLAAQANPKRQRKRWSLKGTRGLHFLDACHRKRQLDRIGTKTVVAQQRSQKPGNETNPLETEVNNLKRILQLYSDETEELLQRFKRQQCKNEIIQTCAEENEDRLIELNRSQSVEIERLREKVELLEKQQQLQLRNELLEGNFMTLLNDANQNGKKLLEEKETLTATVDHLRLLSEKEQAKTETLKTEVNDLQQYVQLYSSEREELLQMFKSQQRKNEILKTSAEENENRLNEVNRSQSAEIQRLREKVDLLENLLQNPDPGTRTLNNTTLMSCSGPESPQETTLKKQPQTDGAPCQTRSLWRGLWKAVTFSLYGGVTVAVVAALASSVHGYTSQTFILQ